MMELKDLIRSWRNKRKKNLPSSPRILDFIKIQEQIKQREFKEEPVCNLCGSSKRKEIVDKNGFRVVECLECGLWYTSPRLEESSWESYLRYRYLPTNINVTENRLHYGVANLPNVGENVPGGVWRARVSKRNRTRIAHFSDILGKPIKRIHDCGCGVGFFIQDALDLGLDATGNDLNGYACAVMREELGLQVYEGNIGDMHFPPSSIDVIFMNDFIEHTYHPQEDLREAARLIRSGGIIFIETFYLDSKKFEEVGTDWNMLTWPHIYHFTRRNLKQLAENAGLTVLEENGKDNGIVEMIFRKQTSSD